MATASLLWPMNQLVHKFPYILNRTYVPAIDYLIEILRFNNRSSLPRQYTCIGIGLAHLESLSFWLGSPILQVRFTGKIMF